MREYRSSNRFPPYGFIMLLLAALVGGGVLGVLVFAVSHFAVYLIVIFPFVIGTLGGFVMSLTVARGKVRNPMLAAFFGLLIAVVLYGTYRYADYRIGFRSALRDIYEEGSGERPDDARLQAYEDYILTEETGTTGFIGYVKLYAQEGITITSTRSSSDSGLVLSGILAYLYWIVEFGIIAFISLTISVDRARQPFSEETNEWFERPRYLGTLPASATPEFLEVAYQGDFRRAGTLLADTSGLAPPRTDIIIHTAKSPGVDQVLVVHRLKQKDRARLAVNKVERSLISARDLEALRAGMKAHRQAELR